MGKPGVRRKALEDFDSLHRDDPMRQVAMGTISKVRVSLEHKKTKLSYEEEFIMATDPLFEQFQERLIAKGKLEGKLEGKRESILALLSERFEIAQEAWMTHLQAIEDPAQLDTILIITATASQLSTIEQAIEDRAR